MDINTNTDVKVVGVPVSPAVEIEDRNRPQVAPVQNSADSSRTALDEKSLHGGQEKEKPMTREELGKAVEVIEEHLAQMGNRLGLSLHKETEDILVRITDRESGELVKQFPSEEIVKLRQKLDELAGLLFEDTI
ncbi:MAG: flagellar protein FlaG [Proteobacteria bacterium]|nr:flagellar protein FlaG [Pseudomonadota bacterium]MBU1737698.1 flagellar protein FlaG [Pseudomonadota bacterium]